MDYDMTFIETAETWRKIAHAMIGDRVRFSTGHQCRTARRLAAFIYRRAWNSDDNEQIELGFDWDSALSVTQAKAVI